MNMSFWDRLFERKKSSTHRSAATGSTPPSAGTTKPDKRDATSLSWFTRGESRGAPRILPSINSKFWNTFVVRRMDVGGRARNVIEWAARVAERPQDFHYVPTKVQEIDGAITHLVTELKKLHGEKLSGSGMLPIFSRYLLTQCHGCCARVTGGKCVRDCRSIDSGRCDLIWLGDSSCRSSAFDEAKKWAGDQQALASKHDAVMDRELAEIISKDPELLAEFRKRHRI